MICIYILGSTVIIKNHKNNSKTNTACIVANILIHSNNHITTIVRFTYIYIYIVKKITDRHDITTLMIYIVLVHDRHDGISPATDHNSSELPHVPKAITPESQPGVEVSMLSFAWKNVTGLLRYTHMYIYIYITLIHIDTYWYILIHIDTYWYILIHIDTYWYILIHIDTYWYILIHIDTYYVVFLSIHSLYMHIIYKYNYTYIYIYINIYIYMYRWSLNNLKSTLWIYFSSPICILCIYIYTYMCVCIWNIEIAGCYGCLFQKIWYDWCWTIPLYIYIR